LNSPSDTHCCHCECICGGWKRLICEASFLPDIYTRSSAMGSIVIVQADTLSGWRTRGGRRNSLTENLLGNMSPSTTPTPTTQPTQPATYGRLGTSRHFAVTTRRCTVPTHNFQELVIIRLSALDRTCRHQPTGCCFIQQSGFASAALHRLFPLYYYPANRVYRLQPTGSYT